MTQIETGEEHRDRVSEYLERAERAQDAAELAALLIEAGWALPGDPPVERWPAYRIVHVLLERALAARDARRLAAAAAEAVVEQLRHDETSEVIHGAGAVLAALR
jgi:hypothetical protein